MELQRVKLHPHERLIKQVCDSVITDRTAADYRPSAALAATGAGMDTKDVIHINTRSVGSILHSQQCRQCTACTVTSGILLILLQPAVQFL